MSDDTSREIHTPPPSLKRSRVLLVDPTSPFYKDQKKAQEFTSDDSENDDTIENKSTNSVLNIQPSYRLVHTPNTSHITSRTKTILPSKITPIDPISLTDDQQKEDVLSQNNMFNQSSLQTLFNSNAFTGTNSLYDIYADPEMKNIQWKLQ